MDDFLELEEFFIDVIDGEHVEVMMLATDGTIAAVSLTEKEAIKFLDELLVAAAQCMKQK